jgi:hypothetical protein
MQKQVQQKPTPSVTLTYRAETEAQHDAGLKQMVPLLHTKIAALRNAAEWGKQNQPSADSRM